MNEGTNASPFFPFGAQWNPSSIVGKPMPSTAQGLVTSPLSDGWLPTAHATAPQICLSGVEAIPAVSRRAGGGKGWLSRHPLHHAPFRDAPHLRMQRNANAFPRPRRLRGPALLPPHSFLLAPLSFPLSPSRGGLLGVFEMSLAVPSPWKALRPPPHLRASSWLLP